MSRKTDSVFFDSSVYINALRSLEYERKIQFFLQGARQYVVNKIVLMELWAGARNEAEENILKLHQKALPTVGMSDDCFVTAGQLMLKMREKYNLEPRLRRRLTWDLLIALSAHENRALIVTENEADFNRIRKFVDFEFISASGTDPAASAPS